ncbi:CHAT domain-containing tetratricopeptide repeat protein [Lentzea sp. NPDC005914]|uniref:CHAT domain-containing protein n=1 Tax=Lentzea sp. NPDC005914 TaxID=3154572 RepID=UPI0033FB78FD
MDDLPRPLSPATVARVMLMRETGAGITNSGRPAAGKRKLLAALKVLGWPARTLPGDAWLTGRVLISLAFAEAERGDTDAGLQLLAEADGIVAHEHRGILLQNRGTILERAGRTDEALPVLDAAVPLLTEAADWYNLASTLLNRATLHLGVGRVHPAREDLRRCREIAHRHGFELIEAKVDHDLAYCHHLVGDIPLALRTFDLAAQRYAVHGSGYLAVVAMDKARALLAAGMASAAEREMATAFDLFARDRLSVDYAWAELTRAQVALALGDHRACRTWAQRAARRFRGHGDAAWAALAELTTVRAELRSSRDPKRLAVKAAQVAQRLRERGLRNDATRADLLSALALLAANDVDGAWSAAAGVRPSPGAPLEVTLLRQLVNAGLKAARGSRAQAFSHLRQGLARLDEHRRRFGSLEMRVGASALGVELARTGLDLAFGTGTAQVFSWSERCRAQAFRARHVRPPADQETREELAEFRQLSRITREAELHGVRDPRAAARLGRLERRLREREWQRDGTGESTGQVSLPELRDELKAGNRTLISFIARDDRLTALVIRAGRANLTELGSTAVVLETTRRLLSDLDALAGWKLPPHVENVLRESADWHLKKLEDHLLTPIQGELDEDGVVVVPCTGLAAIPWGLLPSLRGRAVSVAPSATTWVNAHRTNHTPATDALLVAGPHLEHAETEVNELARIYPAGDRLLGGSATVQATLRALDGADMVHLATHGHHEPDNVLFSCLDLADGPLLAHDLQDLVKPPRHVVLSACDVGQAAVRPGDEILGMTAAMLYVGTTTVVSSVARVPDDLVVPIMAEYHRAVVAGAGPAQALARTSAADLLVPLVCFGAG